MSPRETISRKDSFASLRGRKSRVLFILIFTLIHMLLTALFFFWSFSVVMGHSTEDTPLSVAGEILIRVSDFFQWPLIISLARNEFLRNVLPNYSVYIILFFNSLLWSLVALGIILGLSRVRR